MSSPPSQFLCSLTSELMKQPLLSKHGHHFERDAILNYLNDGNAVCPISGLPLRPSQLISDRTLQKKIQTWRATQGDNQVHAVAVDDSNDQQQDCPPHEFICPLTKKLMKDPVITTKGVNFERKAIMKHLETSRKAGKPYMCPITGFSLHPSTIISDVQLHFDIQEWQMEIDQGAAALKQEEERLKARAEALDALPWGRLSVDDLLEDEKSAEDAEKNESMAAADSSSTTKAPVPLSSKTIEIPVKPSVPQYSAIKSQHSQKLTIVNIGSIIQNDASSIENKKNGEKKQKEQLVNVLDNVMNILSV